MTNNKKQTAVDWIEQEMLKGNLSLKEILEQAKEKQKQYYTEFEVLQLLLKLQQTEPYDNLYDWFQENKKQTFNTKENGGKK
jgi:hypothetical protein